MKAVLISTYELGRQPFGLASPAAWLRGEGVQVTCSDLSQVKLDEKAVREADLVAIYVPMHTATRIAVGLLKKLKTLNVDAHLCAYGLYAPLNADLLKNLGVHTVLGGEFEEGLLNVVRNLRGHERGKSVYTQTEPLISLQRLKFLVPDRSGLPVLDRYAGLIMPDGSRRTVGYTEATRGCKHLCRHCPIVPVYNGQFRVVQRDVVLEDIRRQVAQGAQHITFGDPDFFNGIKHATELVRGLHQEFPHLTYDVTIKVEHLLKHAEHLATLKETGCAFVISAIEAVDDNILEIFDKGHTRADFVRVVAQCREVGLALVPTFVAFTPWITLEGYEDLLETLSELDLVDHVPSIQLAIRLLIPAGSRLLELPDVSAIIGPFDETALSYRWKHPDPRVDALQCSIEALVQKALAAGADRRFIFHQVWKLVQQALDHQEKLLPDMMGCVQRATIPYLNVPWYC
ncbi:MAG: CUAEP/CCAEP-tail radical SAM (seleno)protein [Pyrinomonadaceae bacterium]